MKTLSNNATIGKDTTKNNKHEIIIDSELDSLNGGNAMASCFTCGNFRCRGGFAPSEMQQPSSNPE